MPRLRPYSWCAAAALALAALSGCDHATEPDGPNLTDRFGDFTVLDELTVDRDSVDFAAGEDAVFSARFNKQTDWVLEIEGDSSGAVRRIEGFSNELTEENARWTGRTTELPLFKAEPVTARLFFPEEANGDTSTVSLGVVAPREYPGNVIADFEGGDEIALTNPEFEFEVSEISAEVPPAQGDGFFLLRGTDDVVANNYFIGLITIIPSDGGYFEVPTPIAEDLYFNCFLRGFGTPNTIPVVEVVVDSNGNGVYDTDADGNPLDNVAPLGGDVEFPNLGVADYEGWQLYSEPASSFGAFGSGITDEQTEQIVAVRVVLISGYADNPSSTPLQVEYGIDYLTFTAGGPLEL